MSDMEPRPKPDAVTRQQMTEYIVERARTLTRAFEGMGHLNPEDPLFEALPRVLEVAPKDIAIKIHLVQPESGIVDPQTQQALDRLQAAATERGKTEFRVITYEEGVRMGQEMQRKARRPL